ncbi:MAG: hypothetical protein AAFY59_17035, partial [Pseudomonadota bacterium]
MYRLASVLLLFMPHSLLAQEKPPIWVEAGVSTLGVSVAPTAQLSERFALRAPVAYAAFDGEFDDDDGNAYDVDMRAFQAAIMADYHPFSNGFRISGGVAIGGYEASGVTNEPTYDGLTIPGDVFLDIGQRVPVAPVLSIGYTTGARRGFGFFGEIGAKYTPYHVTYDTSVALNAAQRAEVDEAVAEIND